MLPACVTVYSTICTGLNLWSLHASHHWDGQVADQQLGMGCWDSSTWCLQRYRDGCYPWHLVVWYCFIRSELQCCATASLVDMYVLWLHAQGGLC